MPHLLNVAQLGGVDVMLADGGQNVIHVRPSLDDGNVSGMFTKQGHKLLFDDTPNYEEIFLETKRHLNVKVPGDLNVENCGNNREIIRGNHYRLTNVGGSSSVASETTERLRANIAKQLGYLANLMIATAQNPGTATINLDTSNINIHRSGRLYALNSQLSLVTGQIVFV